MSKSLGNFFTVRDLLDQGVPGEVIRFVMLGTHYRKPMDWTEKKRAEAEAVLRKWRALVAGAEDRGMVDLAFVEALSDDLNTAGAIARLHAMAGEIAANATRDCHVEKGIFLATARMVGLLTEALGGWDRADAAVAGDLASVAARMEKLRAAAKLSKDFGPVDRLKTALAEAGVEVRMGRTGWTCRRAPVLTRCGCGPWWRSSPMCETWFAADMSTGALPPASAHAAPPGILGDKD